MKKMLFSAVAFAVVAVSAVAVAPTTSEAVPAFARQTGAACLNCHFQAIPRLAAFGRNFRMNAYRDMGEQSLIEDDHLSLPAVFNASLMFKARIQNSNAAIPGKNNTAGGAFSSGGKTAIEWPDEAAILIGGRYGENVGGLTEWGTRAMKGVGMGAPVTQPQGQPAATPLSYKLAYVFDTDMGAVAITGGSTDGLGASYIFNDPSNTISRNIRGWQHRSGALGATILNGGTTGVGAYAYLNDLVYVALGEVTNVGGPAITNGRGGDLNTLGLYGRAAVTTELAGLDTVAGFFYGKASAANNTAAIDGTQYGIDLQLQGDLGGVSLGFYLPWVLKAENTDKTTDTTGYYPVVTVGFGHMGIRLGYDVTKYKALTAAGATTLVADLGVGALTAGQSVTSKTTVVGAWYSVAQNVELDLEYNSTKLTGLANANSTTLMLEYVY